MTAQRPLFDDLSPAAEWDRDAAKRALDELFIHARQYRNSQAYAVLLRFVGRFRFYSPFNAMLIHVQMAGATSVAPAYRWARDYQQGIKPGARPLVILQPMGPVMFVFDVSDTETEPGAPPLPPEIEKPFEVRKGQLRSELAFTIENAKRDGVDVIERNAGSQSAGQIQIAVSGRAMKFQVKTKPTPQYVSMAVRYELLLNSKHSAEAKYATLAHELGHLYCGHLGTPNDRWWKDRRGLPAQLAEFEAESVCYLVCERLGIDNPSAEYLSGYVKGFRETPAISFDRVFLAAGLVEQMGRARLPLRKDRE